MLVAQERREGRELVIFLHNQSLVVVGPRAGLEEHFCSDELSIKLLQSEDLWCGQVMASLQS